MSRAEPSSPFPYSRHRKLSQATNFCLPHKRLRRHLKKVLACLIIAGMATKENVRSPAIEDYSKAIYTLETRADEPVSTNALAERLELTTGSVSGMLKK